MLKLRKLSAVLLFPLVVFAADWMMFDSDPQRTDWPKRPISAESPSPTGGSSVRPTMA